MFKITGNTIHCTRGDKGTINLQIPLTDTTYYQFLTTDKVVFTVKSKFNDATPKIRKIVEFIEPTNTASIILTEKDTTIDSLIKEPTVYYYDISLNENETVIGYDEDGGKEFILYPEASNDN